MKSTDKTDLKERELHIFETEDQSIKALARFFVESANETIGERGVCNVVLSGGNSPKPLYGLLASEYRADVEWNKIIFFFADERYTPSASPDNNGGMINQYLLEPLHVPKENIYYVDTTLPSDVAADAYKKRIKLHFGKKPIHFDFVLLGMGEDGHTASLFPHAPVLNEKEASVKSLHLKDKGSHRITMTAHLLNQADTTAFLVYGEGKRNAVKEVLDGGKDPQTYPAQLIDPERGTVHWFLDKKAAGGLGEKTLTI